MAWLSQLEFCMRTTSASPELVSRLPQTGETIDGKYLVDGLCRQDEAAVVLEATRVPFGERVAIEVLRPEWASHGIVVDRFLRDGEAAMRIRSEHAVRVLDEGLLEDASPYLVLEHVEGQSLEAIVSRWGCLPVTTAVDCVLQAMEAIAQAHSYGIVHGDLTPAKMFVSRRPDRTWCVKVDFGHRKVTQPSESAESPVPCAADVRTDVRALGAVLHVFLTGSPPGEAPRKSLPRALGEVVKRALANGPRECFTSVSQLARMLAPFGTAAARVSCERIECLLEDRVSELAWPAPRTPVWGDPLPANDPDPDPWPRPFVAPASGRVVLVALTMLAALGAAAFAALYMSVPRGEPPSVGVAEMQPTTAMTPLRDRPADRAAAPAAAGGLGK
jgi:serine/threonine protein kinase